MVYWTTIHQLPWLWISGCGITWGLKVKYCENKRKDTILILATILENELQKRSEKNVFAIWVGHFYAMKQKYRPQRYKIKFLFTFNYWRCWKLLSRKFLTMLCQLQESCSVCWLRHACTIRGRLPRRVRNTTTAAILLGADVTCNLVPSTSMFLQTIIRSLSQDPVTAAASRIDICGSEWNARGV